MEETYLAPTAKKPEERQPPTNQHHFSSTTSSSHGRKKGKLRQTRRTTTTTSENKTMVVIIGIMSFEFLPSLARLRGRSHSSHWLFLVVTLSLQHVWFRPFFSSLWVQLVLKIVPELSTLKTPWFDKYWNNKLGINLAPYSPSAIFLLSLLRMYIHIFKLWANRIKDATRPWTNNADGARRNVSWYYGS